MIRVLRLGIDVGGTFTDVVAIDAATRALVARVKVPTTHDAAEGVAAGIVTGIERLLREHGIAPSEVAFIAHSTTQATNALLEGDVARVGVVGLLGRGGWLARAQMRFAPVPLTENGLFAPSFVFVRNGDEPAFDAALTMFEQQGVEALAVSEAFAVDRPRSEATAVAHAQRRKLFATSGHDVSSTYGLRARTRTAALNAAILPKMVQTARMTAQAVERAAIPAPLMIMRSDGGVMDVREVERRPILTMLSGPAAGVAGALLYENVTDGIFIEVGGTSSDCSAIRAGQPQMRPARIGGHRTLLRTIDSRTLGIAGGSMLRFAHDTVDAGPRSAHIAGCAYAAFLTPAAFDGARLEWFAPSTHDAPEYLRFALHDGTFATLTPTCASNLLGYVPADSFAFGNAEAALRGFALLAKTVGGDAESLARRMLDAAARKLRACIDALIVEYDLPRDQVVLVGGGGGAAALVPFVAEVLALDYRIARDAEVISPIGVALAFVRDVVERTIVEPTPDDIVRIRREASDRVIAAGAAPDRVEVSIDIDTQRNRVRATASGATALVEAAGHGVRDAALRRAAAARSLRVDEASLEFVSIEGGFEGYRHGRDLRIVDDRAIVRLALRDAHVYSSTVGDIDTTLRDAIERATSFGDVGRALPAVWLIHGGRIADFSGLASANHILALAHEELAGRDSVSPIAILTIAREAS